MEKRKPTSSKSSASESKAPSDTKKSNPVPTDTGTRSSPKGESTSSSQNTPADGGKFPGASGKRVESNPDEPRGSENASRQARPPADVDAPNTSPGAPTKSGLNLGSVN